MNREQLAHVLRSAARVADDNEIVVLGSQAILGTYSDDVLPKEATLSVEADLAFRQDVDEEKSDRFDGAIGEQSRFHETFGYYAQASRSRPRSFPRAGRTELFRFVARTLNRATRCASKLTTSSYQSWSLGERRISRSPRR